MLDCISVENMRLSDQQTVEQFVPSLELIRRAATGVFQAISWDGRVGILAGSGNNGADGFALAAILKSRNIDVTVFTMSQRLHQDCGYYARKAGAAGVHIQPFQAAQSLLRGYDMIVDCLLGTGFQGELRDSYRSAIEEINASGAYVVSVDINSGLNGDTGEGAVAVCSDVTITVEFVKNGLVSENAAAYIKRLVCIKIGIMLAREENKICNEFEWHALCDVTGVTAQQKQAELSGVIYYRCPDWLDMEPLYVL